MKQKQFEANHAVLWTEIEAILDGRQSDQRALPSLHRRLCQCLALARQRGYSPAMSDHLQKMVGRCHRRLYGIALERPNTLLRWMLVDFPCRVRAEWRLLLLAFVAVFGVGLVVGLLVWFQPHWAYSFASPEDLQLYREMYQPDEVNPGRGGSAADVEMFGFYIWNNISINFRTFAAGIFGGIPALLSLGLNGMHMGVLASVLSKDGATMIPFWSFVITHASFELAGLLFAGVAGMRMGLSLIHPGRRSRGHALQAASAQMFPVIIGAALLTLIAAFFEAFWSASASIPVAAKFGVGAFFWLMLIAFFLFAGRHANRPTPD